MGPRGLGRPLVGTQVGLVGTPEGGAGAQGYGGCVVKQVW